MKADQMAGADAVRGHGRQDGARTKTEYLHAVAEAALDGASLRAVDPEQAIALVQDIKGIGSFAAELIVLRGANAPDILPRHERRLDAEITERYGPSRSLDEVAIAWRPYRTWASVHLRTLREHRTPRNQRTCRHHQLTPAAMSRAYAVASYCGDRLAGSASPATRSIQQSCITALDR